MAVRDVIKATQSRSFCRNEECGHVSGPCHVGSTSSHLNTEVKQHRAWIVIGWETAWEFQVRLTKKQKAGVHSGSM